MNRKPKNHHLLPYADLLRMCKADFVRGTAHVHDRRTVDKTIAAYTRAIELLEKDKAQNGKENQSTEQSDSSVQDVHVPGPTENNG